MEVKKQPFLCEFRLGISFEAQNNLVAVYIYRHFCMSHNLRHAQTHIDERTATQAMASIPKPVPTNAAVVPTADTRGIAGASSIKDILAQDQRNI
jgi:hypothetical protein